MRVRRNGVRSISVNTPVGGFGVAYVDPHDAALAQEVERHWTLLRQTALRLLNGLSSQVLDSSVQGEPRPLAVSGKWLEALSAHMQRERFAEVVEAWTALVAGWSSTEDEVRKALAASVSRAGLNPEGATTALFDWAAVFYARTGNFAARPEAVGIPWKDESGGKGLWLGSCRIIGGTDLSEPSGVAAQERFLSIWGSLHGEEPVREMRAICVAAQPARQELMDVLDDAVMRGFSGTACSWCPDQPAGPRKT